MPVSDNSQAGDLEQPIEEAVEVPEQTSEEESAGEEQQPEKKLFTLDEVRKIIREEVSPIIQSQVAKSENRTERRIQERFQQLEQNKGVLKLSDEDVVNARKAIIEEETMKAYEQPGQQGKPTQPTASDNGDDQVQFMSRVDAVFAKEGARLTPQELAALPEWQDPNGDPIDTLIAITSAAREKAAKQKSFKETAKGRVTQGGGKISSNQADISSIKDSTTLYEMGDKQIREKNKR
jgi:hypothetical protein